MADYHGTTCESFKSFFKRSQGIHVDVVGGLVEQQHVTLLLQRHGQVEAVAFAATQHSALLLLVGTREVEAAEVCACIHVAPAEAYQLVAM